jgi:hypothetical protein
MEETKKAAGGGQDETANICIQTLVSGHVQSFSDFFSLVILDKVFFLNLR